MWYIGPSRQPAIPLRGVRRKLPRRLLADNEVVLNAEISDFYSISEVLKPPEKGVYHNNSECPRGRDILPIERRIGTANYRLCEDCMTLNALER